MITSSFSTQAILSVLQSKQKRDFERLLNSGLKAHTILESSFRKHEDLPLVFATTYAGFEEGTLMLFSRASFVGAVYGGQSLLETLVETNQLNAFERLLKQGTQPEAHLQQSFWQAIRLHFKSSNSAKLFFQALFLSGFSLDSVEPILKERNLESLLFLLQSYRDESFLQSLPEGKEDYEVQRL